MPIKTLTPTEVVSNMGQVSTAVLDYAMPWIIFMIGITVAFYISRLLIDIVVVKQTKVDLREQNIRAAIQIENSEALDFEEKYGEKVVSQQILENELLNK
jgi:hypothetical protein